MTKKWAKFISPLLAILLLVPWPVAYTYDNGASDAGLIHVEAVELSAAPD
ncbi:hypothetical protein ACFLXZ_00350 [Chloroflexota bacterium]